MALSRLVPRKGIDLLADVVPAMCSRRPDLHFVIGAHGLPWPASHAPVVVWRTSGLTDHPAMLSAERHERLQPLDQACL